ncbi:hypothetical protein ACOBQJ_13230 [Pelotomaculum propionicicum]|uniref:hypothetical protein n=1 Tax=Pelotomaculum propionicicum TaxID=258475 RepID=UPI003B807EEA
MLTIDEYIAKMKRADKMDEFDYLKQSENMAAVIKYVMTYFNEYLTLETCDAEAIKMKHKMDKMEEEIESKYPKSKEFILNFYLQHRIGIHKELKKWLEGLSYFTFFYSEDDFSSAADNFCAGYKLKNASMNEYNTNIKILAAEIKKYDTEEPSYSEMIHMDNSLVSWVRETFRQYGVDLSYFAYNLANSYEQRYVKYERGKFGEGSYYVNNYNHRYNNNPFDLDRIYEDNKHRPFLKDRRGELEMLVMHEWLFNTVYDDDYWPEYVNLCVARGRVSIVKNINALIPVACAELKYPEDVRCATEHIISTDGTMKKAPQGAFILRVDVSSKNPSVWQNIEDMTSLINTLNETFKIYGAPKVLELAAPVKAVTFDDELFFACCSKIEKKMKKNSNMKLAIVNGAGNQKSKPNSYICTMEDLIKLKVQLRERKIRLQFAIDFPALMAGKRNSSFNQREIFGALTKIKNSIVCMHITNIKNQPTYSPKYKEFGEDLSAYYLHRYKYPTYDDFYTMLSTVFNDNQQRYFIPKNIGDDAQLEEVVDNLMRAGFAFCGGGI